MRNLQFVFGKNLSEQCARGTLVYIYFPNNCSKRQFRFRSASHVSVDISNALNSTVTEGAIGILLDKWANSVSNIPSGLRNSVSPITADFKRDPFCRQCTFAAIIIMCIRSHVANLSSLHHTKPVVFYTIYLKEQFSAPSPWLLLYHTAH